jgi:predicted permease
VTVQVAVASLLLIGAGLLFASFRQILQVDPGFEAEGVLSASIRLPESRYPEGQELRAFVGRALAELRALPGVDRASLTNTIPFGGSYSDSVILAEGYEMEPGESLVSPDQIVVAEGYFETMGIPLVEGRFFDRRDVEDGDRTVIVDEGLARKFWPGRSPLGRRMYRPSSAEDLLAVDENTQWLTVVGVVGDTRLRGLVDVEDRVGTYYFPYPQSPRRTLGFVLKTDSDPALLVDGVRRVIAGLDPELAVFSTLTLADRISESLVARRSPMVLSVAFAGVALFLAAVGLYGVLAYVVSQRIREIGVRMALGSSPVGVFRLIMTEGMVILGGGLAAGLLTSLLLQRALAGHLYGVSPLDPVVLAVVAVAMTLVAVLACSLPALRATRVQPAVALHE